MNSIKLQETELKDLQSIQTKYQDKVFHLGQFYLEKLNLDEKYKALAELEVKLKNEFIEIQKEEQKWMDSLADKYGEGNLSLKDGTFTPTVKQ